MLSEISQTEKDKYCILSLIRTIWKIKQIREYNKKETQKYKLVTASGERKGGRDNRARGLRGTNSYIWNKLQEYIIQNRKYSPYCITSSNGI